MATYEGGKAFGAKKAENENDLDRIIEAFIDTDFSEFSREQLEDYKKQFIEYDPDNSGTITLVELKRMMAKLDQAKTNLELKRMIQEVDEDDDGAISFREFVNMFREGKTSVLRLILEFEMKMKEKERPKGMPVRDLSSLP